MVNRMATRALESSIILLLHNEITVLQNGFERSDQEREGQENVLEQRRDGLSEVDILKFEKTNQESEIQQLTSELHEVFSLLLPMSDFIEYYQNETQELRIKASASDILKQENELQKNEIKQLKDLVNKADILKQENIQLKEQLKIKENEECATLKLENTKQKEEIEQLKIKVDEAENKFISKNDEIDKHRKTLEKNLHLIDRKLKKIERRSDSKENYTIFKKLKNKYRNLNGKCTILNLEIEEYERKYKSNKGFFKDMFKTLNDAIDKVKTFDLTSRIDDCLEEIEQFKENEEHRLMELDKVVIQKSEEEEALYLKIVNKIESSNDLDPLKDVLAINERRARKRGHEETQGDLNDSADVHNSTKIKK